MNASIDNWRLSRSLFKIKKYLYCFYSFSLFFLSLPPFLSLHPVSFYHRLPLFDALHHCFCQMTNGEIVVWCNNYRTGNRMHDYDCIDINVFIYPSHYVIWFWQTRMSGVNCTNTDGPNKDFSNLLYDAPRYRISLSARGRMNITI